MKQDNTEELEETTEVTVPNVTGMTIKEAKATLEEVELELEYDSDEEIDESQAIIVNQTPKEGIVVNSGNTIYCGI